MKKLLTKEKWKRHSAARQKSQRLSAARFADYKKQRNALRSAHTRPTRNNRKASKVEPPRFFSIIKNPGETVHFLNRVRALAIANHVFIDLSRVQLITCDAIAAFLATIHDIESAGARIEGNTPTEASPRTVLDQSGFWDYVKTSGATQHLATMGRVKLRAKSSDTLQARYNQGVASELCEFAVEKLTGVAGPHGPSYSALAEAMLNTLNHASGSGEPPTPWWASVYYDPERQRACFTFIDLGVGIFKSQRVSTMRRFFTALRVLSNADLLHKMLKGEVPSSTRVPGRGNGLPGMFNHCKAGRIRNLTILANDAIGSTEAENFQSLRDSFGGTLLYWEVGR